MNRHISQEKKAEVAKAFKIFLKVDEPAPTDFRGVSPLNNENSERINVRELFVIGAVKVIRFFRQC